MAFSRVCLLLSVLPCVFLLSCYQVQCNDNEDALLRGINTYRQALNLSTLTTNKQAACLADEIADALEDHSCSGAGDFSGSDPTGAVARLVNFPKLLRRCDIDANTTSDGAVLPVCVPRLITDLVLSNYTHSRYAKFLNSSKFSSAGVGSEDDWIVVVLTTDKPTGSFSEASPVAVKGLVGLVLGFMFVSHLLL